MLIKLRLAPRVLKSAKDMSPDTVHIDISREGWYEILCRDIRCKSITSLCGRPLPHIIENNCLDDVYMFSIDYPEMKSTMILPKYKKEYRDNLDMWLHHASQILSSVMAKYVSGLSRENFKRQILEHSELVSEPKVMISDCFKNAHRAVDHMKGVTNFKHAYGLENTRVFSDAENVIDMIFRSIKHDIAKSQDKYDAQRRQAPGNVMTAQQNSAFFKKVVDNCLEGIWGKKKHRAYDWLFMHGCRVELPKNSRYHTNIRIEPDRGDLFGTTLITHAAPITKFELTTKIAMHKMPKFLSTVEKLRHVFSVIMYDPSNEPGNRLYCDFQNTMCMTPDSFSFDRLRDDGVTEKHEVMTQTGRWYINGTQKDGLYKCLKRDPNYNCIVMVKQ